MDCVHVVDDDVAIRRSLAALLLTIGVGCEAHAGGEAFFEEFEPEGCAAVLVDVRMPGMSGHQVLARLGERADAPPAVVMSGVSEIDDAVRAMKAGAFDFLEKPLRPSRLLDTVQLAIAAGRQQRHLRRHGEQVRARLGALSPREREVLRLIVAGLANKQIAGQMGLSQRTVEFHRNHVMQKMAADSLAHLVRMVAVCPAVTGAGCCVGATDGGFDDRGCGAEACRTAIVA